MERNVTVGFAVALVPQAAGFFEENGIDFCCGGHRLLQDVIKEKGLSEKEIFGFLDELEESLKKKGEGKDFLEMETSSLIDYIVSTHHAYLRKEMPKISEFLTAVMRAHGGQHPEIFEIAKLFGALRADLEQHLLKEEMFLFPAISNGKAKHFTVKEYTEEHEGAGEILARLDKLTDHYTVPADACATYEALYEKMKEMEQDLHLHIHLENNILFLRK